MIETQTLARALAHSYRPPQMLHTREASARRPRGPTLWARLRAAYVAFARSRECGC